MTIYNTVLFASLFKTTGSFIKRSVCIEDRRDTFYSHINTYLLSNQSHFRLENQRNYLKPIDLNIRIIYTHFTPKSANLSFFPTNLFLDIQGLIPWTQIILYYLRKSNASLLQDKKIDSTNFFRDFTQAPSNEASFSRQYTEKTSVFLIKDSE